MYNECVLIYILKDKFHHNTEQYSIILLGHIILFIFNTQGYQEPLTQHLQKPPLATSGVTHLNQIGIFSLVGTAHIPHIELLEYQGNLQNDELSSVSSQAALGIL